jgi:hypothetical protein
MEPAKKIERLIKKRRYKANPEAYDKTLGSFLQAVDAYKKQKSTLTEPSVWRIIMKSRITKLAAAAVIIIPILIGINQFGGSIDGASVVWADVIKNVEQIQTFTCRLKMDAKGMEIFGLPQKVTSIIYNSSHFGRRVETYIGKKEVAREFWLPEKNEIIVMVPEAKVYLRKILLSEDMFNPTITQDPYTFLKEFMLFKHSKLGRKRINGIAVEGIHSYV